MVELNISNPQNNFKTTLNAFSVPFICHKLKTQNLRMAKERFTHLSNIKFSDELLPGSEMEVDILIGGDYMWAFMESQTKRGEFDEPVAVLTKLGWVISGPMKMECKEKLSSINFVTTHILKVSQVQDYPMEDNLSTQLEKFWSLDSIGIQEKDTVHEAFLKNIEFKDERYSVKLPFKEHHDILPDNYENAVLRLKSNLKRLNNQPEVLQEYDSIIQEQLKAGIIEKVNADEIPEVSKTHYIPHHPVIRKQALSTKLRIVYDASNRLNSNSPSLNDILYVGPLLTPLILDILLRFRAKRIGLVADVEKVFHQISIDPKDRNCLRFVWIDDINKEDPDIVIFPFARVPFGVNSSPFLLNGTLKYHIEKYQLEDPKLVDDLLNSFYVDDLSTGADNINEAFLLYKKSKNYLADGNFHLEKVDYHWMKLRR